VEWMGFPLYYAYEGAEPPARSGADHASIYPYGAFTTSDDELIMLGLQNEREWEVFCRDVIGQEELTDDERFNSNAQRSDNREQLRKIIQAVFSKLATEKLVAKLDQAQIAYANVNDMDAVWNHPQLAALNRIIETETPAGRVTTIRPPGNNSSYEPKLGPVPGVGEHTRAVLEELEFTEEEIQKFYESGVV